MLAQTPPMGWNTWNTFGNDINEQLILESADAMVEKGYRDAGYEYIVIYDCWSLRRRDEAGELVADPVKFPHGMKYVADYVHSKGLKFGMYSCAGVTTCAGYPGSFDHEYQDARRFASWGVDYLKYDFCNFPSYANNQHRYLTMAMALRSCGRDIVFSACNWGVGEPWNWMRSIGAHLYRSTGDIVDTFDSAAGIMRSQADKFNANAPGCFNDMDMLTVGMFGNGLVARETTNTPEEYTTQFAYWCFCGAPLMMGGDIRELDDSCRALLQNRGLIALDRDAECRPPYRISTDEKLQIFVRHLSDGTFAIGAFNYHSTGRSADMLLSSMGVPYASGMALELTNVLTGEKIGTYRDNYRTTVPAHGSLVLHARFVPAKA